MPTKAELTARVEELEKMIATCPVVITNTGPNPVTFHSAGDTIVFPAGDLAFTRAEYEALMSQKGARETLESLFVSGFFRLLGA